MMAEIIPVLFIPFITAICNVFHPFDRISVSPFLSLVGWQYRTNLQNALLVWCRSIQFGVVRFRFISLARHLVPGEREVFACK